ncbi:TetR family transcriptional regulator [Neisseria sp.]|uniref:multidrug efflux system transcriptional repressor MtrR n=1 Tax=Neisseria sp. TaxID=192066 RepID=UPI0035A14A16
MRKTKVEALKTREHLMLAALDTFHKKGVARTSLNEIAQNAGVTRGALYWHFKNKEDLFEALFQRICNDIDSCMAEDLSNEADNVWESFRMSLMKLFLRVESNSLHNKFYNILYRKCEHTEQNEAIISIMSKYQTLWNEKLHDILNDCIAQHSLDPALDIDAASVYIKANITGLQYQWLNAPYSFELNQMAARIIPMMLDNLKNSPMLRKVP